MRNRLNSGKTGRSDGPHDGTSWHDGPSQVLISKHLENLKLGTENRLSELRNGMAGRTVTDYPVEIESLTLAMTCRTDRRRHDGPSQVAQIPGRVGFLVKF